MTTNFNKNNKRFFVKNNDSVIIFGEGDNDVIIFGENNGDGIIFGKNNNDDGIIFGEGDGDDIIFGKDDKIVFNKYKANKINNFINSNFNNDSYINQLSNIKKLFIYLNKNSITITNDEANKLLLFSDKLRMTLNSVNENDYEYLNNELMKPFLDELNKVNETIQKNKTRVKELG